MNTPYLGSKISLISRAEIRYEGILYQIDQSASTVALANVKSYGTENRPTDKPVAAQNKIYQFIIFRGQDIKDLSVSSPPNPLYAVEDDPAIVQTSDVQLKSNSDLGGDDVGQQGSRPQMSRQPPGLNNSSYMSVQPPLDQQPYMVPNEENASGYVPDLQVSEDYFNQGKIQRFNNYIPELETDNRKDSIFLSMGLNKDHQFFGPLKYEGEKLYNEDHYQQVDQRGFESGRKMEEKLLSGMELDRMRLKSGGPSTSETSHSEPQNSRLPEPRYSNYSTPNDNSSFNTTQQSHDIRYQEDYHNQHEPKYDIRSNEQFSERRAQLPARRSEMPAFSTMPRMPRYPPPQRPPYQGTRAEVPKPVGSERIPPLMPDGWQYEEPRMRHSSRPRHFMPPQRLSQYNDGRGNGNWRSLENNLYRREFDFERSNAKFSKEDIENEIKLKLKLSDGTPRGNSDVESSSLGDDSLCEGNLFYDKAKSFFDKISCNALDKEKSNQLGWKDEKRMNAETFGLPTYDRRPRGGGGYSSSNNQGGYNRMYNPRSQGNWPQPRFPRSDRPNVELSSEYTDKRRAQPQHINSRS